uniref:Uncharacterized protein n=1 Tax=Nelumbo nucifera TaxID=4432 RepID=A0A822Y6S8_NELNU|nr:TPA_asm: hypothetical protein HUJ06_028789 [Nelumbo nucifera]
MRPSRLMAHCLSCAGESQYQERRLPFWGPTVANYQKQERH